MRVKNGPVKVKRIWLKTNVPTSYNNTTEDKLHENDRQQPEQDHMIKRQGVFTIYKRIRSLEDNLNMDSESQGIYFYVHNCYQNAGRGN